MKFKSKVAMAVLTGAAFLMASPAVHAAAKKKKTKSNYSVSSMPNPAANAASGASQSAVRNARDDAARRAKAKQIRDQ